MIDSLRIHNIALIEDLTICFYQGLHVLTGETGAGKSIVVDAVNLVLGGRADKDLIRTGTDKAWVEAEFLVQEADPAMRFLAEQHIESEGMITLYREITRGGRNICRVCGVVVSLALLKDLAVLLMDIHGQHEHRFLMDPAFHMDFLDASGDETHMALMQETASACEIFLRNHRAYAKLLKENENRQFRTEMLTEQLKELKKARIKPDEAEKLEKEQALAAEGEKLNTALREAEEFLEGENEAGSAMGRIREAAASLRDAVSADPAFRELSARLDSCYYELEDIGRTLRKDIDASSFDPERFEAVARRLELLRKLERKFGMPVNEIVLKQEEIEAELDRLNGMDDLIAETGAEHKRLLAAYRTCAGKLTASRKELAAHFEEDMTGQLRDLGMEKTIFRVSFSTPASGKKAIPTVHGDDMIEFMISPNPGEPLKPLGKIASGGELSRLMLAIKSLDAARTGVGCMVFDEIDTGISGRMAQTVAEKMKHISRSRQVICVTHLPQIAAMADCQYLVAKYSDGERTHTSVTELDMDGRVSEVARMLGGAQGIDESARSHAAHMIGASENHQR